MKGLLVSISEMWNKLPDTRIVSIKTVFFIVNLVLILLSVQYLLEAKSDSKLTKFLKLLFVFTVENGIVYYIGILVGDIS